MGGKGGAVGGEILSKKLLKDFYEARMITPALPRFIATLYAGAVLHAAESKQL